MSRNNKKKKQSASKKAEKLAAKKQARLFAFQRNITIFALLVLFVVGLVSTTFASFNTYTEPQTGSLLAEVLTTAVNQNNKDIADTKANVDSAQTKANSSGGYIYFVKPATWTASKVQFCIGHGSYTSAYEMTKLSGNLYYLNLKSANGGNSWNGHTYHAVIANSSNWGSGNWGSSNLTNATNYTTANSEYGFNDSNTYLITATNTAKGATITTTYKANNSTQYTTLNTANQTVYSYSAASGSSTYSADAAAASTLSVKTQQLSGNGTLGSATTTSKTASATSANRNAAQGTSVTVTAAAATGYTFKGWYSSSTSTTALSTSTSYTYNAGTGNTSVYAKFDKAGYSYTISAGTGGTVSPSGAGKASSVTVTATPSTGYNFSGWETTGGSVASPTATSTTFTPTEDGATCKAVFTPKTTTVTLNKQSGTGGTSSVTATYNAAMPTITVPSRTGYTFKGYYDATSGGTQYYTATGTSARTWNKTVTSTTLYARWEIKQYTLSVTETGGTGTVTLGGTTTTSKTVNYNTSVAISITPPSGYRIKSISGAVTSGTCDSYTGSYTVKSDATITVVYEEKPVPKITFDFTDPNGINVVRNNGATLSYINKSGNSATSNVTNGQSVEVLYGSEFTLSVNLIDNCDYYITGFNNLTLDSSTLTLTHAQGSYENITGDVTVSLKLSSYNNFTLSYVSTGDTTIDSKYNNDELNYQSGGSQYTVGTSFRPAYGQDLTITVPTVEGYYPRIFTDSACTVLLGDISYDKSVATFSINVTDVALNYYVEYLPNPTINVEQPQYGSIYVTSVDDNGNTVYHFNNDTVYAGTELTVHTMVDNSVVIDDNDPQKVAEYYSCVINSVTADTDFIDYALDEVETSNYTIIDATTFSADISMTDKYLVKEAVADGYRRIFFTDVNNWSDGNDEAVNIACHYSNRTSATDITTEYAVMSYQYDNNYGQPVFYVDIPVEKKYVVFYNLDDTTECTVKVEVSSDKNAFYLDDNVNKPYTLGTWNMVYSDYVATDRGVNQQQAAKTYVGQPVTFTYDYTFSDDSLQCEVVAGDSIEYLFRSGTLTIKPTDNELGYSLIKVYSNSSHTAKYYLIKVNQFKGVLKDFQKIYQSPVSMITLNSVFTGCETLNTIQYNISENNLIFNALSGTETVTDSGRNRSFKISASGYSNGVRYFQIKATDETGYTYTLTEKAVFDAGFTAGDRLVYLRNNTNISLSTYNIRACFEADGKKSWVTMQPISDSGFYRAAIPYDCDTSVSFYVTEKDVYLNTKSDGANFADLCVYYAENIVFAEDVTSDVVYSINSLHSTGSMGVEVSQ